MNQHANVFLNCTPDRWPRLKEAFQAVGRYDLVLAGNAEFGWNLQFTLPSTEYELLRLEVEKRGIQWHETRTITASEKELQAAAFLRLRLGSSPLPLSVIPEESFDFGAGCQNCGTGATARNSIRVRVESGSSVNPGNPFIGHTSEGMLTVVSKPVWQKLDASQISGYHLCPLFDVDSNRELPFNALIPDRGFSVQMDSKTEGLVRSDSPSERGCPVCLRDGYFESPEVPLVIVYPSTSQLESFPDISETWEHFGVSGKPSRRNNMEGLAARVAPSLLLVRPRVWSILRSLDCPEVHATPVQIL